MLAGALALHMCSYSHVRFLGLMDLSNKAAMYWVSKWSQSGPHLVKTSFGATWHSFLDMDLARWAPTPYTYSILHKAWVQGALGTRAIAEPHSRFRETPQSS